MWHCRQADPEFGGYKATELYENLVSITASLPVEVSHGKRIVEVRNLQRRHSYSVRIPSEIPSESFWLIPSDPV